MHINLILYPQSSRVLCCVLLFLCSSFVNVKWLDPSDGKYTSLPAKYINKGMGYFEPPAFKNKQGFDDWVLILASTK